MGVGLRQTLPNLEFLPDMGTGTSAVTDGTMYKNGNRMTVEAMGQKSPEVPYTQQCFGVGNYSGVADVSYFTCQASPETFVAGFYSFDSLISRFAIDGELANPLLTGSSKSFGGSRTAALDLGYRRKNGTKGGLGGYYRGFGKKTYGGSGPSINHLILVPEAGGTEWHHVMPASIVDNSHDAVMGEGSPVKQVFYVMWAGRGGHEYSEEDFVSAMDVVLQRMPSTPPFLLTTTTTSSSTTTPTTSSSSTTSRTTTTRSITTVTITTGTVSTTTTTTTTPLVDETVEAAIEFHGEVSALVPSMLGELRDQRKLLVMRSLTDQRRYTVQRIRRADAMAMDNITMDFDMGMGRQVSVYVPGSVLRKLGGASASASDFAVLSAPIKEQFLPVMKGNTRGQLVKTGIELSLYWVTSGEQINTTDSFPEPIQFSVPVNYTERMTCEYWNTRTKRWSRAGTWASPRNRVGRQLECMTNHLSFFGALEQLCVPFEPFSDDALGRLGQVEDWGTAYGSMVWWVVLAVLGSILFVSFFLDWKRKNSTTWSRERLLVTRVDKTATPPPGGASTPPSTPPTPPTREGTEGLHKAEDRPTEERGPRRADSMGPFARGCILGCCVPQSYITTMAMRAAIDNIFGNWYDWLYAQRLNMNSVCRSWDICCARARTERFFETLYRAMRTVTLSNATKLAGQEMALSANCIHFVTQDEVLQDFLDQSQGNRDLEFSLTRSGCWQTAKTREEAWSRLHFEVRCSVQKHLLAQGDVWSLAGQMRRLFVSALPPGDMWNTDLFMSCKLRGYLYSARVVGALFWSCLFFQAWNRVDGIENESLVCLAAETDTERDLRITFVSLLSLFIASNLVSFLTMLHVWHLKLEKFEREGCTKWKTMIRAWHFQDILVWSLSTALLAFMLFYVCLFLANLSESDQGDFGAVGIILLLLDFLVAPALGALARAAAMLLLVKVTGNYFGRGRQRLLKEAHLELFDEGNAAGAKPGTPGTPATPPPVRLSVTSHIMQV